MTEALLLGTVAAWLGVWRLGMFGVRRQRVIDADRARRFERAMRRAVTPPKLFRPNG